MAGLKQLIHEIHRRSLWQVLTIYGVASWLIYEVVEALTSGLGLPQWLPAFAIVLLLLGLPIVLATAFVQEGISPTKRHDPTLVPAAELRADARPHEAAGARRLFSWRNAISGGVLALALWGVLATSWYFVYGESSRGPRVERATVAVLPFINMSADPENEYFSDGITDAIITHLAKIADLSVTSRTSSMRYKNADKSLGDIAQELGVAAVVEGGVQRVGDRVSINAQLIDAESDEHLWAEIYERDLADVFAIQSEVALSIASALAATLTAAEEQRIERPPTANLEAYNLYLLGRHWLIGRYGLERALEYFEGAIELDSAFALAHVGIADSYNLLAFWEGWDRAESVAKGRAAALRALAIDNTLGEAYATLGAIEHWLEWEWEAAKSNLERAIALKPGYAEAHKWYGQLLSQMSQPGMGLVEIERALQLDPLSPIVISTFAQELNALGRYDEAIDQYRKLIELAPDFPGVHGELGTVYLQAGMYEEAIEEFQPWSGRLTAAYSALGMAERAAAVLEESKAKSLVDQLAAQVGIGHVDEAFRILDQLVEQRSLYLTYAIGRRNPYFGILHADPRYDEVRRRMGLP